MPYGECTEWTRDMNSVLSVHVIRVQKKSRRTLVLRLYFTNFVRVGQVKTLVYMKLKSNFGGFVRNGSLNKTFALNTKYNFIKI
jgi:hypothetical protein